MNAFRVMSATRTIFRNDVLAAFRVLEVLDLRIDDVDFIVVREVVERGKRSTSGPSALVDLLRAVVKAGRVAETDRVVCCEQPERRDADE